VQVVTNYQFGGYHPRESDSVFKALCRSRDTETRALMELADQSGKADKQKEK